MKSTVVILVHGYNVADPGDTVGKLRPHFERLGAVVEAFDYGFWPFTWQVTKGNIKEARELAVRCCYWKDQGYRVIVVGHSNGVCITYLSTKGSSAPIDICVGINPALQVELNPAPGARLVHIWHNEDDSPTKWAVWLRKIFKGVRARPWGAMGANGYSGSDLNVINFNAGRQFSQKASGHSDVFSRKKKDYFLPLIASFAFNEDESRQ